MSYSDTDGSSLADLSDQVLVRRSLDADAEAFGQLVRRHTPLMRAYVSRIVGSLSEADDVVQEAYVTAWRQLHTLKDPSAAKAWLMKIASRGAFAYVKARRIDDPIDRFDRAVRADTQPEQVAVRHAQLKALSDALNTLPEEQRRCWLLREVAELSYGEIAEEMDIAPSTVRGILSRARASITIQMEGWR